MNPSLLSERLAALRAKQDASNMSILSECRTAHSLSSFLILYTKADRECYINYMEGTKALLYYLTYDGASPLYVDNTVLLRFPQIADPSYKLPNILGSYVTSELAGLLSKRTYGAEWAYWNKAVCYTLMHLTLEGRI